MKKKQTLGNRFKFWRLENEWTQAELGKKLGLSNTYLSEVEHDRVGIGNKTLLFLNTKLDLDLNWLITGKTK